MKYNIFIIVCISIVAISCTKKSNPNDEPRPVKTITINCESISDSVILSGKVIAGLNESPSFNTAGQIEKIYVKPGDKVKVGDILATIKDRDLHNTFIAAKSKFDQVSSEVGRVKELFARNSIAKNEYEKAIAGLEQVEAIYNQAKNSLSDSKLVAIHSGVVENVFLTQGDMATPFSPVMNIINTETLYIETFLSSALYLQKEDIHNISTLTNTGEKIPLTIQNISMLGNNNQLYRTILEMRYRSKNIAPGMILEIKMFNKQPKENNHYIIPVTALVNDGKESFVWVVDTAQMIVNKRIIDKYVLHHNGNLAIQQGVNEGEIVVSAGANLLKEKDSVKFIPNKY